MWSFVRSNPELVVAVMLYVLINVAPRPHPDDHSGWARLVWLVLDRIAVLSAQALPGRFKWIFRASARPDKVKGQTRKGTRTDKS